MIVHALKRKMPPEEPPSEEPHKRDRREEGGGGSERAWPCLRAGEGLDEEEETEA